MAQAVGGEHCRFSKAQDLGPLLSQVSSHIKRRRVLRSLVGAGPARQWAVSWEMPSVTKEL